MTGMDPNAQPPQQPETPATPESPVTPPVAPIEMNKEARQMAMLAHLLGFITGFLGALVIWLVKKEVPFVESQAKEALNFQITVFIAAVALGSVTFGVGSLLVHVANIIFCIIGGMKANEGIAYRYPVALRLIK